MEICNISLKYREIIFENYIDQNLINNSCLIDIAYLIFFFFFVFLYITLEQKSRYRKKCKTGVKSRCFKSLSSLASFFLLLLLFLFFGIKFCARLLSFSVSRNISETFTVNPKLFAPLFFAFFSSSPLPPFYTLQPLHSSVTRFP